MKKYLGTQRVFNFILKILAFFAKRNAFAKLTHWATQKNATLNLKINRPKPATQVADLAKSWKELMPYDGQEFFKISSITEDTAYTEIHLHCPLRGTGNVEACYKLMNYDRRLMKGIGGKLVVLESQSNSGKAFCSLAIRKESAGTDDLIPAHKRSGEGLGS